jgi:hypothetical protein
MDTVSSGPRRRDEGGDRDAGLLLLISLSALVIGTLGVFVYFLAR